MAVCADAVLAAAGRARRIGGARARRRSGCGCARWWADLVERRSPSSTEPDVVDDLGRAPGDAGGARPTPNASPTCSGSTSDRLLAPDWFQQPADARLRGVRRPLRRRPARRRRARRVPAPSSASRTCTSCRCCSRAPATTTAATPSPTTARCAPTSAPSTTSATWPTLLRRHGISLCLDLVLNHVAREHEWAERGAGGRPDATAGSSTSTPTARCPTPTSARCPRCSPTSRPAASRGTTTLDGWVWTTFNSWQWDLDWSNPDVVCELRRHRPVPRQPRRRGAPPRRHRVHLEADRHDLPEPARGARHHPGAAGRHPDRRARPCCSRPRRSSAPADVVHYLGRGRHHGKVSDLAYHNSLMVQIWSMLASRDVRALGARAAGDRRDPVDDRVDHVRPVPRRHRLGDRRRRRRRRRAVGPGAPAVPVRLLLRRASGSRPRAGLVFQHNEATGDRRISGTRGQPGRARRRARARATHDAVDQAVDRILSTHDDRPRVGRRPGAVDGRRARRCATTRLGRRPGARRRQPLGPPPADAVDDAERRTEPGTVEQRVFDGLVHRVGGPAGARRTSTRRCGREPLDPTDPGVLAVVRRIRSDRCSGSYNVTDTEPSVPGVAAAGHRAGAGARSSTR